ERFHMKANTSGFHPRRNPANARTAVLEREPIERRTGIEQRNTIAMIDKGIHDDAEGAGQAGRDQNLLRGTDAQTLIVSQLGGDGFAQLEQSAERRPTPALGG